MVLIFCPRSNSMREGIHFFPASYFHNLDSILIFVCSCKLGGERSGDIERYRSAHLQAERLLDAREQSHRQQVLRLENQVTHLFIYSFIKLISFSL